MIARANVTSNLLWAERALKHVKTKMTTGAMNKFGDVFRSAGYSVACVIGQRAAFMGWAMGDDPKMLEMILGLAAVAEKTGCGNCGEQACLAFAYLYLQRDPLGAQKCGSIELMEFSNGDHGYVVIGRPKDSDVKVPASWGPEAVVCDPWKGHVYLPIEMVGHWPGMVPALMYRAG